MSGLELKFQHSIGGTQVDSIEKFGVIDPSTGEIFEKAPDASEEIVNKAVESSYQAFKTWSITPIETRKSYLTKIGKAIITNAKQIAPILVKEQGKPLQSAMMEIVGTGGYFQTVAGYDIPVTVVQKDSVRRTTIVRKPIGVVAAIAPWNFPILTGYIKVASAMLAGCTVILKPSPYTPLSTLLIGKIISEIVPAGVVNVISGTDKTGELLTKHELVSKISFTGSIPTGKKIMQVCGNDLKRVTLELGGNDAAIVREDVDIKSVVPKILSASMANSGQVCAAIKRIYVHESKYNEFCEEIANVVQKNYRLGNGFEKGVTHGPINNKMQFDKVCQIVEDAKKDGGIVLCGGNPLQRKGYFYPITVIKNVKEGTRLVDDEQFGPVVPVISYKTDEEAILRANDTKFGLCGSIWTKDVEKGAELATKLDCGTAWVNTHLEIGGTPFGGTKWSGIGREHGPDSIISTYTEIQVIMESKL